VPPAARPASPPRTPRPVTPSRRASRDEAPPAPWGSFPLVELAVLLGLVLMAVGFLLFDDGARRGLVAAGLAMASLAGLEVVIREHFAGYRSHTSVLALAAALVVAIPLILLAGVRPALAFGVAIVAGAFAAYVLREAFARRAGGLTFRT
jgi:prepilin signal peptidase PulO-like enzyme (type II secretory pathway)